MHGEKVSHSIMFHGTRELPQTGFHPELLEEIRGFEQRLGLQPHSGTVDGHGAFALRIPHDRVSIPEGELAQFTTILKERFGFERMGKM